jgi:hypothetical protein
VVEVDVEADLVVVAAAAEVADEVVAVDVVAVARNPTRNGFR